MWMQQIHIMYSKRKENFYVWLLPFYSHHWFCSNRPLKREHESEMDLPTHARLHGIRILFFVHISFVLLSYSLFPSLFSHIFHFIACTYNTDSTKGLSIMIHESRRASHMRTSPKINRSRAMSHTDPFKVCLNVYTYV